MPGCLLERQEPPAGPSPGLIHRSGACTVDLHLPHGSRKALPLTAPQCHCRLLTLPQPSWAGQPVMCQMASPTAFQSPRPTHTQTQNPPLPSTPGVPPKQYPARICTPPLPISGLLCCLPRNPPGLPRPPIQFTYLFPRFAGGGEEIRPLLPASGRRQPPRSVARKAP